MKKLALLLLAVLFISCSTDEASSNNEPDCNCDRVFEYNDVNNQTGAQTGWILVSNAYPNFTTDCSLNGQISNQQSQSNGITTRLTRHRIICR